MPGEEETRKERYQRKLCQIWFLYSYTKKKKKILNPLGLEAERNKGEDVNPLDWGYERYWNSSATINHWRVSVENVCAMLMCWSLWTNGYTSVSKPQQEFTWEGGRGWASQVAQWVRNLPAMGREDPLEEGMVSHSIFLPGESPWTEEPGGL